MCWAGALRGSPASTTATRRRARARTRAADRPAAPPPTTTTSYSFMEAACAASTRSDNHGCHSWESPVEWPDVRPRHDRGGPGPRGAAAPGDPQAARCHAERPRRAHGDLQEHAVAAGERPAARPAWSCCCRWRRPTACRSTTSWAHRRSPTHGSGSSPARSTAGPCSRSPGAAQRRPGLEDRHPRAPDDAPAPRPRRLRVALRAVGTDAPGPRRPRPGAGPRRGRRVRHAATPLVRVDRRGRGRGAEHLRPAGERMHVRARSRREEPAG